MSNCFVDTSALIKKYSPDDNDLSGASEMAALVATSTAIYVSAITRIEMVATLARKGNASPQAMRQARQAIKTFDEDYGDIYRVVPCSPDVLDIAKRLAESGRLFGCDAIQLASALFLLGGMKRAGLDDLVFVSSDERLNAAAIVADLTVDNPSKRKHGA